MRFFKNPTPYWCDKICRKYSFEFFLLSDEFKQGPIYKKLVYIKPVEHLKKIAKRVMDTRTQISACSPVVLALVGSMETAK